MARIAIPVSVGIVLAYLSLIPFIWIGSDDVLDEVSSEYGLVFADWVSEAVFPGDFYVVSEDGGEFVEIGEICNIQLARVMSPELAEMPEPRGIVGSSALVDRYPILEVLYFWADGWITESNTMSFSVRSLINWGEYSRDIRRNHDCVLAIQEIIQEDCLTFVEEVWISAELGPGITATDECVVMNNYALYQRPMQYVGNREPWILRDLVEIEFSE